MPLGAGPSANCVLGQELLLCAVKTVFSLREETDHAPVLLRRV